MQSLDPQLAGFKQRADGAYIINMRDDIYTLYGYYVDEQVKAHDWCVECFGYEILAGGFHPVPRQTPLEKRYVCQRCKSINRKHLITLVGIDYCRVIDLIQQGNGLYTREDGVVFLLIDHELTSR